MSALSVSGLFKVIVATPLEMSKVTEDMVTWRKDVRTWGSMRLGCFDVLGGKD